MIQPKTIAAFLFGAAASVGGAVMALGWIETRTEAAVRTTLTLGQHDWADVAVDGLQVILSGTAPDEATHFRAISHVGRTVDPDRIVDDMGVAASARIEAPEFTVEMLRNEDDVSLIGLIPTEAGRDAFTDTIAQVMTDTSEVTEMLEEANFPTPRGWEAAIGYATRALNDLPRSKISVSATRVEITAISESPEEKRRIEAELARAAPSSVQLLLNISAPRPVITPFTLRYTLSDGVGAFDACSADSNATSAAILNAAAGVGTLPPRPSCAIGLGVPSPTWAEAVGIAMQGLAQLGGGSLTFSDADVSIVALEGTSQATFDRVVGDLDATLPDVFSLYATLPETPVINGEGEPEIREFVATHSPEGLLQLRGRLPNDGVEQIVGSFARAQFGSENVYLATRDDESLAADWPVRVLAGLEALALLENGALIVQEDYLELRGVSGDKNASDSVSRLLADKLENAENFELAIRYDELLDVTLNIPTPDECVSRINAILNAGKIVFAPSSSDIPPEAQATIDAIAEIAKQCDRVKMEIGGHTDSQGREIMNETLSQARADAVLFALQERRVLTSNMTARGYGEVDPIADNDTEAGREANRRIAFTLLTDARAAPSDEVAEEAGSQDGSETEGAAETTPETGEDSEQN
ncbi:MAG: OmpA family protein [Pseudomonadota bacterium]